YASQVLRNARTANTASQQSFIENTKKAVAKSGWLSAATYISTMSRYTNNYLDAIANVPHVIPPRLEIVGSLSTEAKKAVDEIGPWLAGSQLSKSDAAATRIVDGEGLWQTIFTWLSIDWIFNADGHNPFQELTSLGHYLINGTSTTISFLTAASMGSGRAKALGFNMDFFTSAWQVAGGYIMLVLYIIMAAGIALAFILPNIPFIRYLFAIATWVLAVIEGLISIPIFLWAHVSSSKKDLLAPELMQGYLMILHIILRPALMVFGLVFAMIMFREMMILFNAQFVPNLVGVEDSLDVGLITFAAYLVLYCVIAYGLLNACFKAIDLLPNSVMRWIGSHMSQGQDESNDIVGKASGGASKIETLRFASRGGAIKPGGGGMP
ncbi:MAG: DotA/TraY family protein, partial [Aestuariibacter sp.]|nr:DotA/TraY family protein [Aestuariibacter sp.]